MTVTITPARLRGAVVPPASKSQAHRFLIAAALAEGESTISGMSFSRDMEATMSCLEELGASFRRAGDGVLVRGCAAGPMSPMRRLAPPRLDCGESGSTLRFLIPVALAVRGGGIFTGHGRLMERPQEPYFALFREKGIFFERADGALSVRGLLSPGVYRLPGDVSSQFFTGLLFALPLLDGPSALIPTTELESMDYVTMTLAALERFGVRCAATFSLPPQYHVQGGQAYCPAGVTVERDWSQAAFWYAAAGLGSAVAVEGMDPGSLQLDRQIVEWARLVAAGGDVSIDVSGNPDLVPPIAALGAVMDGTLHLTHASRLRLKESDRLRAVREELNKLGANVAEGLDSLTVEGVKALHGGVVESHNDHRIAMMLAVAATRAEGAVVIRDAGCVEKSYPAFWSDYASLGGQIQMR